MTKCMAGFALVILLFSACKEGGKSEQLTVQQEEKTAVSGTGAMELASFEVEGMTCALGCAKLIESKLAALDGVKTAKVDFETKKAVVEFDDAKQNSETITKTVEKIANGIYKVAHLETKKAS
ncbi:cation transporter [Flavobacterium sp. NKUCC04_CG]|nr:cation transporter [Flavobacterium sp. NKUCC04_CG]